MKPTATSNGPTGKGFKVGYNINGSAMRSLVREHAAALKLKGNKRIKKNKTDPKRC